MSERCITKRLAEVNYQPGGTHITVKQIMFKTFKFGYDSCDFSDACIGVKGKITVDGQKIEINKTEN